MTRIWRDLWQDCAQLALPQRCLQCGQAQQSAGLCAECWTKLRHLTAPWCARCGRPFDFDPAASGISLCGACSARKKPVINRLRAALAYDDASRPLILALKHADRLENARWAADLMVGLAGAVDPRARLIIPVPLHRRRYFHRRYNQAALLSAALSRRLGIAHIPDALLRLRATASQGRLTRSQRQRNMAGAFAVNPRYEAQLAGGRVILVDDVWTTGATLEACARKLTRAGVSSVSVLVLARVVRPDRHTI